MSILRAIVVVPIITLATLDAAWQQHRQARRDRDRAAYEAAVAECQHRPAA